MITIKSAAQIEKMRAAGALLHEVLEGPHGRKADYGCGRDPVV